MAQQGGSTKKYLADLTLQPAKVVVCVRVVRKWIFNGNVPGAAVRYIGLVLTDEKGDSIYAEIPQMHAERLGPLIECDKVYSISKFTVRTSKSGYVPFERKFMIEFNAYTVVREAADAPDTFPTCVYQLTPFCNINPFGSSATKLIDVLGILCSIEAPKPLSLPKKERVATIREIVIKNESNEDLKITLWDDRATAFSLPVPATPGATQSVVVLFVGCQPTTLNKVIQVYGGAACHWYFNPNISEAQPLYNRLKLSPIAIYRPPAQLTGAPEVVEPIIIEHKTLAELNEMDPYEIPKVGYKCTVTITEVYQTPKWWYVGCAKCGKAPEVDTVPFQCRCGWKESTPLYKLNFQAKDDTSEARFFCYDTISRRIIKRNINFMLRQSKQSTGLPQHLHDLISKKYTFVVGVTASSFQDPNFRTYLVKTVAVDYQEQVYIANRMHAMQPIGQATASSSSILAIEQSSPPSILLNQTPTVMDSANATGATTPPPLQYNDETPRKDEPTKTISAKPSAAKTLFPVPESGVEVNNQVLEQRTGAAPIQKPVLPAIKSHVVVAPVTAGDPTSEPLRSTTNAAAPATAAQNLQETPYLGNLDGHTSQKPEDAQQIKGPSQHGSKRARPTESITQSKREDKKAMLSEES